MKTPSKTPSKTAGDSLKPWEVDPYDSPSLIRTLFTPSKKTSIGPTPQKDGQVLGLFDLLTNTPEKVEDQTAAHAQVGATPRKAAGLSSAHKHSRTPSSVSRQFMINMFTTPRKGIKLDGKGATTPSSVSKLHFATPSFLRRDSQRIHMPPVNEEDGNLQLSPQMVRVPRKPIVRGLSSMLASLRKMEEQKADEDLEALHEMENDLSGPTKKPPPTTKPKVATTAPPEDVLVEDSQPGFPLGGFDASDRDDSEPEVALGRDGLPLKVYKKKGQKRTTRRVKMKPSRSKPAPAPSAIAEEDSEDELAGDAIPDTQLNTTEGFGDGLGEAYDSGAETEYTASEGGTRYRRPDQGKTKKKVVGRDGKIVRGARKVTSLASQNFKRLKLRNSGAKGPSTNSRFRRKK